MITAAVTPEVFGAAPADGEDEGDGAGRAELGNERDW